MMIVETRMGSFLSALLACALLSGCSMTKLAVGTQAEVMQIAYPAIEKQTDYEFARLGIPGNLLQIEAMLEVKPDDKRLLLLATRGFTSYAYGFIEDEMQQAQAVGDHELAAEHRARARALHLKARDYGMRLLRQMSDAFPEPLPLDPAVIEKVLDREFNTPDAAPALLWAGVSWAAAINISRDDGGLIADLPYATVLVKHSVKLDETYYNAMGHMILGAIDSTLGEALGGKPESARKHFERALALTKRKAALIQVNFAESYAVLASDRALFTSLLEEALALPLGEGTALALPNLIAKRRAKRLLAQRDDLVPEDTPPPAPPAAPVAPVPAAPAAPTTASPPPEPPLAPPVAAVPESAEAPREAKPQPTRRLP